MKRGKVIQNIVELDTIKNWRIVTGNIIKAWKYGSDDQHNNYIANNSNITRVIIEDSLSSQWKVFWWQRTLHSPVTLMWNTDTNTSGVKTFDTKYQTVWNKTVAKTKTLINKQKYLYLTLTQNKQTRDWVAHFIDSDTDKSNATEWPDRQTSTTQWQRKQLQQQP